MMPWSNLTKSGLFFNIVSPAFHTLPPSVLQRLDSRVIETLILILEKVLNCRIMTGPILLPIQMVFHVGEQKIVRWCQIRRIWTVINQFKATVTHSSHCNHRLVAGALSWWNRTPFVSFPGRLRNSISFQSPEVLISIVGLSGRKQCSYYQGNLDLMHAKFHCCDTTPSQSAYELYFPFSFFKVQSTSWCITYILLFSPPSYNKSILDHYLEYLL